VALTWTKVPPVAPGDPVTSTQLAKVADAFNDRLRCNAGDSCERVVYYGISPFRQIRNSDGGFLFPPQTEFFHFYQNLKADEGTWPLAGPGEPEGANLACIINSFVFGADAIGLASEDERIANPAAGGVELYGMSGVPTEPEAIWALGKVQRGAISPNLVLASPAFSAAVTHYRIRTNNLSPHGNSYGGFMAVPVDLADCENGEIPDYQIFFTNLYTGEIRAYPGTCPEQPGHIAQVVKTPRWYLVWFNNGSVEILPIDEWIEGPYSGGASIKRNWGDHLPRFLNAFTHDFRGTASERDTQEKWLEFAFDRERFLTSQYHLAPNMGQISGDEIDPVYPLYLAECDPDTSLPAATILTHLQSGTPAHQYQGEFVLASALLTVAELAAPCPVEFWSGSTLLKTVTVTPDEDGLAPQIIIFEPAILAPNLRVQLPGGAEFLSDAGEIRVECSELLNYQPQHHDLYLVLRLASARTTLVSGLDGSGQDESDSDQLGESYFTTGAILNTHDAPGPAGSFTGEVNSNAVFDAARRLSQFVRVLPRAAFLGYAVEDGKTVCWFKRFVAVSGVELDQFQGIGPSRTPIETLVIGREYVVRGGTITHDGDTIPQDATFTATAATFTGAGTVYVRDGIRALADPGQFTNEWLMGTQLKVYGHQDESIWKPDAYSDYHFWSDRCHFYHGLVGYNAGLKRQFDYGQNVSVAPEAFSGWRYAGNTNRWLCDEEDLDCQARRIARYKSCRIYEPMPEIESAVEDIEFGVTVIKLTFKGRFHHHDAAPASLDRNTDTWDAAALQAEDYRTMENALREYLILQERGLHCVGGGYDLVLGHNLGQQGNSSYVQNTDTDVWGLPDNPHGACFPHFYFLQLFKKPYEDGNNRQDAHDTPLTSEWWMQADFYLRGMCEGFVDAQTTKEQACTFGVSAVFCYTFESLCFQSHGLKWLTSIATVPTPHLDQVRPDAPEGFGQAPALSLSSECYNQVGSCLNQLDRVQIMLPQQFQVRSRSGSAIAEVDATWPSPAPTCATGGQPKGYYEGTPKNAGADTMGDWEDASTASSVVGASISNDACSGDAWLLQTSRGDSDWRWAMVDSDAWHALPPAWQSGFGTDGGAIVSLQGSLIGIRTIFEERKQVRNVADIGDASHCLLQTGYWIDPDGGYLFFEDDIGENSVSCEFLGSGGTISTAPLGRSVFAIGRDISGNSCMGGSQRSEGIEPILGDDTAMLQAILL